MKKNFLTLTCGILIIIGLIFISSASPPEAINQFSDQFYYIKKHLLSVSIGIIIYFVFSKINLGHFQKYSPLFYYLSAAILLLVLLPTLGQKALGARRWLEIGNLTIQPTEVFKLTTILFFANLFSQEKNRHLKNLLLYLLPPVLLVIFQPNLSTAIIIILLATSIYYLSGAKIIPLAVLSLGFAAITLLLILTSSYRFKRLQALISPQNQDTSLSYHSNQITLAISSGGLFGKGLANSEQKYRFLPKISTDSILAIIGEETGFIGISFVILLYLLAISKIFLISKSVPSSFESLSIAGIGCWLAYQSLINIASLATIIPLTGIPLPFISYGGSATISLLTALGLVHHYEKRV